VVSNHQSLKSTFRGPRAFSDPIGHILQAKPDWTRPTRSYGHGDAVRVHIHLWEEVVLALLSYRRFQGYNLSSCQAG
jgi:hypothetical protein